MNSFTIIFKHFKLLYQDTGILFYYSIVIFTSNLNDQYYEKICFEIIPGQTMIPDEMIGTTWYDLQSFNSLGK